MNVETFFIDGLKLIKPDCFGDNRGWFMETYSFEKFKNIGIDNIFIQDNHSFSKNKGTLRGLHFQNNDMAQTKLVRCTRGTILDVAVDLRPSSKTYKSYVLVELSEENKHQFLIPKGFAHGFLTLTDDCEVQYKVDELYSKEHDRSIRYDDPDINIEWPSGIDFILSDKDKNSPFLMDSDVNFA